MNVFESGRGEGKAKKRPMSAAQKARHEKHQKLLKVTGAKKSKAPRKKARGKTEISKTASRYEDIEKEIEEMAVFDEAASSKSVKREYEKLMKKWGDTPITKIPFKDFERIRELGDNLMGTPKGAGTKVGDLLKHMNELYAPGNISRNRNPDFDERQAMFNSNYKRIHKKNPSKAEMRAAGVGKGGDNPKGVKAWKAAMVKLKASEGRK